MYPSKYSVPLSKYFESNSIRLLCIFAISHFFILLNFQGKYWDDWVISNVDSDTLHAMFNMSGGVFRGYLHRFFSLIGNGVFGYRVILFIAVYCSGVAIYKILDKYYLQSNQFAFFAAVLYLTLPLNNVQIALINTPSILFVSLFFIALYFLGDIVENNQKVLLRIGCLLLFFISFNTNSLLLFYLLAIAHLYVLINKSEEVDKGYFKSLKVLMTKYADFLLLPALFYSVKIIFFSSWGLYENYNAINFDIERLLLLFNQTIATSIIEPITQAVYVSVIYWWVFLILCIVIAFLTVVKIKAGNNKTVEPIYLQRIISIFLIGSVLFIMASLPYLLVGKLPHLGGWESRHQLLMPLGLSLILIACYAIVLKLSRKAGTVIIISMIASFSVQNIYSGYRFINDWFYQVAIEENMLALESVKNNHTFSVDLNLPAGLVNERNISFYEFNGRLKKIFHEDSRLMFNTKDRLEAIEQYKNFKQYNFSSWEKSEVITLQIRETGEQSFSFFINLLLLQMSNTEKFKSEATKLVIVSKI